MVAPLIAAAGIGAVGSLLGGIFGGNSAKKAAQIQRDTAREQIAAANANRDYQYSLNAPTIDRGDRAADLFAGFNGAGSPDYGAYVTSNPDLLAAWNGGLNNSGDFKTIADFGRFHYGKYGEGEGRSLGSGDGGAASALDAFRGSTGYQDLVKEGLGAVNANAYASGMGRSGATLKALQDRGMSLADRSSQTWLGNLNTVASAGGQARGLVAGIGTNTVNMNNAASQGAADASSNAALAAGSNWSNTLQNLGLLASNAYGSSYGGGASGIPTLPTWQNGTPPYAPGAVPQFGYRNVT